MKPCDDRHRVRAMTLPAVPPKVGLFVTCLVDLFRPSVGFAAVKLLEDAGCTVERADDADLLRPAGLQFRRPGRQPGAGASRRSTAFELRLCRGAVRLLRRDAEQALSGAVCRRSGRWRQRAEAFAGKVHELISFLVDICGLAEVDARFDGTVTYHDSCSGLRELGIRAQPRACSPRSPGLDLIEMRDSRRLLRLRRHLLRQISRHLQSHRRQEDSGSRDGGRRLAARRRSRLPHEHGRQAAAAQGSRVDVRHVAEVLAGMTDDAADRRRGLRRADGVTSPSLQGECQATRLPTRSCRRRWAMCGSRFVERSARSRDGAAGIRAAARQARDIKDHTLAHLDLYLEAYEEKVTAAGGHVHWAETAADARAASSSASAVGRAPAP